MLIHCIPGGVSVSPIVLFRSFALGGILRAMCAFPQGGQRRICFGLLIFARMPFPFYGHRMGVFRGRNFSRGLAEVSKFPTGVNTHRIQGFLSRLVFPWALIVSWQALLGVFAKSYSGSYRAYVGIQAPSERRHLLRNAIKLCCRGAIRHFRPPAHVRRC